MTAPTRRDRRAARTEWLAHRAMDAFGVLCLILIGALIGVAVCALYLAQGGALR